MGTLPEKRVARTAGGRGKDARSRRFPGMCADPRGMARMKRLGALTVSGFTGAARFTVPALTQPVQRVHGSRVIAAELLSSVARKGGGAPVASIGTPPYNPPVLNRRRKYLLVAIAVLVAAFVVSYPYLGAVGFCGHSDQCPQALQGQGIPYMGLGAACAAAVLATSSAALTIAVRHRHHRHSSDPRPPEIRLSPEPPPPRFHLSF